MLGRQFKQRFKKLFGHNSSHNSTLITRANHELSRKDLSSSALKVLYRLQHAGYAAYLVGGGVRDVLLKRKPKDFDVATDARPEQVRALFRNSRMIGRRFRIVHVYFRGEIIEVSTFRANTEEDTRETDSESPFIVQTNNTYGTIEEDAWRRDFTVNALYYNIKDFSIVDYMTGLDDLQAGVLRIIGDPIQRFHEDPVRLLRAIRLAAKLNFTLHPDTEQPLRELPNLLQHVSSARLFDEVLKLFFEGNAEVTYHKLLEFDYFKVLFPQAARVLSQHNAVYENKLVEFALKATDSRFDNEQSLNPGFLLAVLLWPALQKHLKDEQTHHKHFYQVLHAAMSEVLDKQTRVISIPKRLTSMMRSMWLLQHHLQRRRGQRVFRALHHRYFRAAYDFLLLRVQVGEPYQELADWWQRFQEVEPVVQNKMIRELPQKPSRKR